MNKIVKKIIAREGLIILAWITLTLISIFNFYSVSNSPFFTLIVFGYPLYLIIRFIIWAIKTLFPEYYWIHKISKLARKLEFGKVADILKQMESELGEKEFKRITDIWKQSASWYEKAEQDFEKCKEDCIKIISDSSKP